MIRHSNRRLFSVAVLACVGVTIAMWISFTREQSSAALERSEARVASVETFDSQADLLSPSREENSRLISGVSAANDPIEMPQRVSLSLDAPDSPEELPTGTYEESNFGRIVGTLWGPDNELVPSATLYASRVAGKVSVAARADPLDGTFRTRPIPAGVYSIEISAPNFSRQLIGEFELARRGELDLGVLRFHHGVRLDIRVVTSGASPPRPCTELSIAVPDTEPFASVSVCAPRTWSNSLEPGRYELRVDDPRFERIHMVVDVTAESDSIVEVTLREATSRRFRFIWVEGKQTPPRIDWILSDIANTRAWNGSATPEGDEPVDLLVGSLEADAFEMRVTTPDGRGAQRLFSVLDLEPVEFVITLLVD